jgi:hypothetical protein
VDANVDVGDDDARDGDDREWDGGTEVAVPAEPVAAG